MSRPRIRDVGIMPVGIPTGLHNAITDVAGVRVGHATLISGEGPLRPGTGPVRTGVTAILPHEHSLFRHKVRAAVHTINGFGKVFGFEQVRELGAIESPIALTNTLNVGLVADALIGHAIQRDPDIGISTAGTVNVVVGETNDGYLNDIQGRHVRAGQVRAAIASATAGPVVEGAVGAGTGTICYGWKGGIGTASRVLPEEGGGYTVGALVQSNFGCPRDLVVCGVPVGREILPSGVRYEPQKVKEGSIMIVLATDAPPAALETLQPIVADEGKAMYWLFPAVVESVEEAVLNSLFRAETMTGRDGHTIQALPVERVLEMCRRHGVKT